MQPMQTAKIGGFASIDNHPIGRIDKNPWGDAVCLFKSSDGYPFFFNFHDDSKCGHTIFFGKSNDIQRNAISNFLITHSRKFEARIISFDRGENTKICNAFLGGKYKTLSFDDKQNTLKFNPVKLLAEPDYFKKFIEICLQLNGTKLETLKAYISEKLIPFIVANQAKFSNFHELINFINNEKITNQFFTETSKNGVFYGIFGGKDDDIISLKSGEFLSINLYTLFVEEAWVAKFFFEYFRMAILHLTKDKKRTIIKMDSFFELCEICEISKEEIIAFLKALKENNVVLLALENYVFFENYQESEKDAEILELFSTQIYNPAFASYGGNENNISNNYLKQLSRFSKLTEREMGVVSKFAFDDEVFVVKHSDKLVALEFKYDFSNLYYFIFSGKEIDDDYLKGLVSSSTLEGKLEEANNIYRQFFTEA
jgi:type IV secretory pathway VirB4 component